MQEFLCTFSGWVSIAAISAVLLTSVVLWRGGSIEKIKLPHLFEVKLHNPIAFQGSRFWLLPGCLALFALFGLIVLSLTAQCEKSPTKLNELALRWLEEQLGHTYWDGGDAWGTVAFKGNGREARYTNAPGRAGGSIEILGGDFGASGYILFNGVWDQVDGKRGELELVVSSYGNAVEVRWGGETEIINQWVRVHSSDFLPNLDTVPPNRLVVLAAWPDNGLAADRVVAIERGLDDVPYHFLVTENGVVEGRPVNRASAMVRGMNVLSLSVAVTCANWTPRHEETCELSQGTQIALERLLAKVVVDRQIPLDRIIDRAQFPERLGIGRPGQYVPLPTDEMERIFDVVAKIKELSSI